MWPVVPTVNMLDSAENGMLPIAVRAGQLEIVQLLVEAGAGE